MVLQGVRVRLGPGGHRRPALRLQVQQDQRSPEAWQQLHLDPCTEEGASSYPMGVHFVLGDQCRPGCVVISYWLAPGLKPTFRISGQMQSIIVQNQNVQSYVFRVGSFLYSALDLL
jgi:hypothetical protein